MCIHCLSNKNMNLFLQIAIYERARREKYLYDCRKNIFAETY